MTILSLTFLHSSKLVVFVINQYKKSQNITITYNCICSKGITILCYEFFKVTAQILCQIYFLYKLIFYIFSQLLTVSSYIFLMESGTCMSYFAAETFLEKLFATVIHSFLDNCPIIHLFLENWSVIQNQQKNNGFMWQWTSDSIKFLLHFPSQNSSCY